MSDLHTLLDGLSNGEPIKATLQKLDEMQALCDAATEGPWKHLNPRNTYNHAVVDSHGEDLANDYEGVWYLDEDAEFIAASRTDMPRLITALQAVLEEHRKVLWHTEACTHWPDMDCDCVELENGDWYEPYVGYFICETCSGDVTCHGSANHTVEYPCPTVKAVTKAMEVDDG